MAVAFRLRPCRLGVADVDERDDTAATNVVEEFVEGESDETDEDEDDEDTADRSREGNEVECEEEEDWSVVNMLESECTDDSL